MADHDDLVDVVDRSYSEWCRVLEDYQRAVARSFWVPPYMMGPRGSWLRLVVDNTRKPKDPNG